MNIFCLLSKTPTHFPLIHKYDACGKPLGKLKEWFQCRNRRSKKVKNSPCRADKNWNERGGTVHLNSLTNSREIK